jgi:diguanylate cyclase (GGDEF)-like protein
MFDIDHFKAINDVWGHLVGDQILIEATQAVQSEMRNADLFGRYGGEEFIMLLPMTNANQAYILAERIRTRIASLRVSSDKGEVSVTISIGIAELRHNAKPESMEALFNRADEAMYAAKQAGRNCTVIYE